MIVSGRHGHGPRQDTVEMFFCLGTENIHHKSLYTPAFHTSANRRQPKGPSLVTHPVPCQKLWERKKKEKKEEKKGQSRTLLNALKKKDSETERKLLPGCKRCYFSSDAYFRFTFSSDASTANIFLFIVWRKTLTYLLFYSLYRSDCIEVCS